ncbi:hypothetical protein D3C75_879810 [compost metagenome]
MANGRRLRRILWDTNHQEDAEKRDGAGDQERRCGIDPGDHHPEHGTCGITDIGQGVAQRKGLCTQAHGQVFAEDRLGANEEKRRGGFGDHQGDGGEVEIFGKGQQHEADGTGEHRQYQQPAFFQAVDDVAAIQGEQGGDEHRDAEQ